MGARSWLGSCACGRAGGKQGTRCAALQAMQSKHANACSAGWNMQACVGEGEPSTKAVAASDQVSCHRLAHDDQLKAGAATGAVALSDKQTTWCKALRRGYQAGLSQVTLKDDSPPRRDSQIRLSTRRWLGGLVDLLVWARLQLLRKLPFGCLICAGIGLVLQQRRHLRRPVFLSIGGGG